MSAKIKKTLNVILDKVLSYKPKSKKGKKKVIKLL